MKKYLGYLFGISSLLLFSLSYFLDNIVLFFIAIPVLVLGIFIVIFTMTYDLYQKDKQIDYELVKKSGLTLVICKACEKENVLEDQYCIFCGESLEKNDV